MPYEGIQSQKSLDLFKASGLRSFPTSNSFSFHCSSHKYSEKLKTMEEADKQRDHPNQVKLYSLKIKKECH